MRKYENLMPSEYPLPITVCLGEHLDDGSSVFIRSVSLWPRDDGHFTCNVKIARKMASIYAWDNWQVVGNKRATF